MLRVTYKDMEYYSSAAAREITRLDQAKNGANCTADYVAVEPLGFVFDYDIELSSHLESVLNTDPCVLNWELYGLSPAQAQEIAANESIDIYDRIDILLDAIHEPDALRGIIAASCQTLLVRTDKVAHEAAKEIAVISSLTTDDLPALRTEAARAIVCALRFAKAEKSESVNPAVGVWQFLNERLVKKVGRETLISSARIEAIIERNRLAAYA